MVVANKKDSEEGLIHILNSKLEKMWASEFTLLQNMKKADVSNLPCGDQDAHGDALEAQSQFVELLEDVIIHKRLTLKEV